MTSEIVRIDAFGLLTTGFRTIRVTLAGQSAVFELVPEVRADPDPAKVEEQPSALRKLFEGAQLIVEGPLALRLEFCHLLAVAGDADVDNDLFGGLHENWVDTPRIEATTIFYPLLEIANSSWKAQLPEWRRKDDPAVRHFRMISADCSFDVLGELLSGAWVANATT